MIDFELMVRNVLWEDAPQMGALPPASTTTNPPAGTQSNNQNDTNQQSNDSNQEVTEEEALKQDTSSIYNFLKDTKHTELKKWWSDNFNKEYLFCTTQELEVLCKAVTYSESRRTTTPEKFPKIENIYPLLDLIATLYVDVFKGTKKGASASESEQVYNKFKEHLNKQKQAKQNLKPLDYEAISTWARAVKSVVLGKSKTELGKLRLDDYKNYSFYNVIFNLLAIRKKILFPKLSQGMRMANGAAIVDKILLEPWTITQGTFAINDSKIEALYDKLTVKEMVDVSIAMYKLFIQQSENISAAGKIPPDPKTYALFVGKGTNGDFTWTTSASTSTSPTESFNEIYDTLNRQLLSEDEGSSDQQLNNTSELKPFQVEGNNFKYTLGTLQSASKAGLVEAQQLLEELERFATYIKTKEGRDIMGSLGKIAQGITGLGKG